jgi:hypothetical protein
MNGGLLDIRPPPLAPEGIGVTAPVVALLLLSALLLLLRRYRSPRHRARRALVRLRAAVAQGRLDNRAAAHALAGVLRQGDSHLGIFTPGLEAHVLDAGWADYSRRLAEARFAPRPCSHEQLSALLDEAGSWLERRP